MDMDSNTTINGVSMSADVVLGAGPLGLVSICAIARGRSILQLSKQAIARLSASRQMVERLIADGKPAYGVTTGVGDLCTVSIKREDLATLSNRIILSHACGVGAPLTDDQVRAVMVCGINNFTCGYSGVRPRIVQTMTEMLNKGLTPQVPRQGSVGYIIYMAHIAAAMLGYGKAKFGGETMPAQLALARAGIERLTLHAKEGISLVNGTPGATGLGVLAIADAERLLKWADVVAAFSFEALTGSRAALDHRIHRLRPHRGQQRVADNMRRLLAGSANEAADKRARIQDALSLRAIPQVHGAARDQAQYAREIIETEIMSVTDNPLLFQVEGGAEAISGANAHGQPVALAVEALGSAMASIANISERRTFRLVAHAASGLPAFLAHHGGLNTGLMIPQYVSASLVAENKVLAHPMSVDTILTSGLQEDHLSFATPAALNCGSIIENTESVLAIELLSAAQAHEFILERRWGMGTRLLYDLFREQVPAMENDRLLADDIQRAKEFLCNERNLEKIENLCDSL